MSNQSGFQFARLALGISFAWLFAISSTAGAQQFNLEGYLLKKDVNKNGRLEPEELSDNAKNMLKKMGFDDSKSNSIKRIVGKVNSDRKEMAKSSSSDSSNAVRKVPGFGVESKEASAGVARFGASAAGSGGKGKTKFSDSVNERVQSTLDRYDKNKDGSLDKNELSQARWGSPPPEQNDTNRDGRLSRDELAVRYQGREQQYQKASPATASTSTRSSSNSRDSGRDRRSRDRESFRSTGGTASSGSSRTRSTTPSRTATSSSSGGSADSQAKYEKYAESLVSQYDTDKDGKLSSDETKKMRRPPAGADSDKDGFITKEELVGSLSNTAKPAAAAKSDSEGSENSRSRSPRSRESSSSESRSSSRGGSSSSFDKLDENGDRQIQMHEFSKKWDDKTVDEFYEKDRNGDGVITSTEWSGK